jgi:hypothetical protein
MAGTPICNHFIGADGHAGARPVLDAVQPPPLSNPQIRARLTARLNRMPRSFFRVGRVRLRDERTADAEIRAPSGEVVLRLEIDRLSGRIVRYD